VCLARHRFEGRVGAHYCKVQRRPMYDFLTCACPPKSTLTSIIFVATLGQFRLFTRRTLTMRYPIGMLGFYPCTNCKSRNFDFTCRGERGENLKNDSEART
jgi:hypothetical protein